jgi:hypothetical protein
MLKNAVIIVLVIVLAVVNGLQTFSIHDYLTGKTIGFNISNEGFLESYMYRDKNYIVMTNMGDGQSEKLIQREERYNNYKVNFEFLLDGSTNLTVKNADLVE